MLWAAIFFLPLTTSSAGVPDILWTYEIPVGAYSAMPSPAIGWDGTIYLSTAEGLYAVTNTTAAATNKWIFRGGAVGPAAVGPDGTIYCAGRSFYGVNPDGSQRWSYPFWSIGNTVPAISLDGTVYVVGDGRLYAFTPGGAVRWTYPIGTYQSGGSPVIGPDGSIYVANDQYPSTLFAFTSHGKLRWTLGGLSSGDNLFLRDGVSPAIGSDGTVYSAGAGLNAIHPDGSLLWSNFTNNFFGASPVLGPDGTVYIASSSRSLFAMGSDGVQTWASPSSPWCIYHGGCVVGTCPAINSEGGIYYCVSNGITAFSPQKTIDWTFTYPDYPPIATDFATSSPAIGSDGTIYVVLGSTLFAFASTNALADSSWPMYRQNPQHTGSVEKSRLFAPTLGGDGVFEFFCYGRSGKNHRLEASSDFSRWITVTNFAGGAKPVRVLDTEAGTVSKRFYRVVSD
jgi:hypothetical protein